MQSQACAENGGADGAADGTKVLWASVLRDVNVPSALSSAGLARPEGIAMQRACFTNPLGASAPWQAGQKGIPGAHHLPSANAAQRRRSHGCRTTAPRRSPSQERVVAEARAQPLRTAIGISARGLLGHLQLLPPRRDPVARGSAPIWLETPLGLGLPSAGTHETPTDRDHRGGVHADGADTRTGGGRHSEQYVAPGHRPDAPHLRDDTLKGRSQTQTRRRALRAVMEGVI